CSTIVQRASGTAARNTASSDRKRAGSPASAGSSSAGGGSTSSRTARFPLLQASSTNWRTRAAWPLPASVRPRPGVPADPVLTTPSCLLRPGLLHGVRSVRPPSSSPAPAGSVHPSPHLTGVPYPGPCRRHYLRAVREHRLLSLLYLCAEG